VVLKGFGHYEIYGGDAFRNKQRINKQSSERWPWRPLHRGCPYQ